jgi:rod shape-determining protein MreC
MQRLLQDPVLRREVLKPSSSSIVVPATPRERAGRAGNTLAWVLGAASMLLVWQMSNPLLARPGGLDQALTGALVPVWHIMSQVGHGSNLVAVDPTTQRLRTELVDAQRRMHVIEAENQHLRRLVHLQGQAAPSGHTVTGQVVARDPNAWLQTLVLDVGRDNHLRPGLAVLSDGGVVGQLADVSPASSRVQTITSHGAMTAATITTRHAAGVLYGVDGRTMELRYLDPSAGVKAGDLVTTSGGDRYPEGLSIGRVTQVKPSTDGASVTAVVRPAVPLDTVKDVLVVQRKN